MDLSPQFSRKQIISISKWKRNFVSTQNAQARRPTLEAMFWEVFAERFLFCFDWHSQISSIVRLAWRIIRTEEANEEEEAAEVVAFGDFRDIFYVFVQEKSEQ